MGPKGAQGSPGRRGPTGRPGKRGKQVKKKTDKDLFLRSFVYFMFQTLGGITFTSNSVDVYRFRNLVQKAEGLWSDSFLYLLDTDINT